MHFISQVRLARTHVLAQNMLNKMCELSTYRTTAVRPSFGSPNFANKNYAEILRALRTCHRSDRILAFERVNDKCDYKRFSTGLKRCERIIEDNVTKNEPTANPEPIRGEYKTLEDFFEDEYGEQERAHWAELDSSRAAAEAKQEAIDAKTPKATIVEPDTPKS